MRLAGDKMTQVAFRLPEELLARIDAEAQRLAAETPGWTPTRTDVVRILLERGLAAKIEGPR